MTKFTLKDYNQFLEDIVNNNIESVKRYIEQGINVNFKNEKSGTTPALIISINFNRKEIFNLLINIGADVNIRCEYNETPLMHAVRKQNLSLVKKLIRKGADVNAQRSDGVTALMMALAHEYEYNGSFYNACGDPRIVKELISAGADVNLKDKNDRNALIYAINIYNQNINDSDKYRGLENIKLLLKAGSDINIYDKSNKSPLLYSVEKMDIELIKLLLEMGANLFIKNKNNQVLIDQMSEEIENIIITGNFNNKQKCFYIYTYISSDLDVEEFVFSLDTCENVVNLLNQYCDYKSEKLIKLKSLINILKGNIQSIDYNIVNQQFGSDKYTPIMLTVKHNIINITKFLLENGANINLTDSQGNTPLMYAIMNNNIDCVKLLLEVNNIDFRIRNKRGQTAMDIAESFYINNDIKRLLEDFIKQKISNFFGGLKLKTEQLNTKIFKL